MPSIAIIGTEGSGKTVFITTLAKRFGTENSLGVFLNPQTLSTARYVEQCWTVLNSADWPPSTPPGSWEELIWTIEYNNGPRAEVHLVDCPGQDLRLLYAEEQTTNQILPVYLQRLDEHCRTADIVLLMVNLKDFIGESDNLRRTNTGWVTKYVLALRSGSGRPGHAAIVFTQVDQYMHVLREHGGWPAVLKKYLPYVYGTHAHHCRADVLAVSAVWDTQVIINEKGEPYPVPVPNFKSRGMDEMVKWIGDQLQMVEAAAVKPPPAPVASPPLKPTVPTISPSNDWSVISELLGELKKKLVGAPMRTLACAILGMVVLVKGCNWLSAGSSGPPAPPPPPVPRFVFSNGGCDYEWHLWSDSGWSVWYEVTNRGASGQITVHCSVNAGTQTLSDDHTFTLASGETKSDDHFFFVGPFVSGATYSIEQKP